MTDEEYPRLRIPGEFDAYDVSARGWLQDVVVELPGGRTLPVSFFDPVRLQQGLEDEVKLGRPYIAEKNMIVLEEVTFDNMLTAVRGLHKVGFFESTEADIAADDGAGKDDIGASEENS